MKMVYDTQNEDPERGEYRSLYSDQGGDGDEEIDTPSTTPLYTQPTTPNDNTKSEPKPNNRRCSWTQYPQNLRLPTTNEVKTIVITVFGALGFIIGVLLCTLAIIGLIYGCGQVVDYIRHIGEPSPYRGLSDYKGYVAVDDDINDPYPYPSYSLNNDDDGADTVPEATTTKSGIEAACVGEGGACEGRLSESTRIPKATRVAIITDWKGWSDFTGEDLDVDGDVYGLDDIHILSSDDLWDVNDDDAEFPIELACGDYDTWTKM